MVSIKLALTLKYLIYVRSADEEKVRQQSDLNRYRLFCRHLVAHTTNHTYDTTLQFWLPRRSKILSEVKCLAQYRTEFTKFNINQQWPVV